MLAVDDESYVFTLLQNIVRWDETEFRLENCVMNGEEALRLLENKHFDIVLADLDMPVMDGFALIEEIGRLYKNTITLVLSVFSDFVSIRKAFQLGAKDYILKYEIEHEYVIKTLRAAIEKSQAQDDTRLISRQFELSLCGSGELGQLKKHCMEKEIMLIVCKLYKNGEGAEEKSMIPKEIQREFYNEITLEYPDSLLREYDSHLVMLLILRKGVISEKWLKERLERLAARLKACGAQFAYADCFLGISGHFRKVEEIQRQYKIAKNRLRGAFLYDTRLILSENPEKGEVAFPKLKIVVKQILSGIQDGEQGTIIAALDRLEREIRKQAVPDREAIIIYLVRVLSLTKDGLEESGKSELKALHTSAEECNHLMAAKTLREGIKILKEFMDLLAIECRERGITREERMIRKAIRYMEEHYSNDLSLAMVSKELGISPNYFSSLFMKSMHNSFSACLTDIRMKHAKELLVDSDKKIYEIARACGYPSVEHFSRSFKKTVGVSPAHYKDNKLDS